MTFMPICINLTGRRILIVGGGRVAEHKLISLLRYTDRITVIAPCVSENIRHTGVTIIEQSYTPAFLKGIFLVYACTNNQQVNRQIKQDAATYGILVNVADSPSDCDFTSPAIYKKGYMSVAVSSNAVDVKRAIQWRNHIKNVLADDTPPEM